MNLSIRKILIISTAASALLHGNSLSAQESTAPDVSNSQADEAAATRDAESHGEILVVAQRRSERLLDVPIAITAVSGNDLAERGATDLQSLSGLVPSLNMTRGPATPNIYMRGIGNNSIAAGQEQSVAVYVDGVYYPATYSAVFEFNDIDHVEVLKGPQGTLFGRNATGGVIHVITREPSHDLTGKFEVGYGNYDTATLSAYVSGGISDNLATSFALQLANQGDGWGENIATNEEVNKEKTFNLRNKWLWSPSEDTSVGLKVGYFHTISDFGTAAQPLEGNPQVPATKGGAVFNGNIYDSNVVGIDSASNLEQYNASLHISHDFGAFRLSSISSYQKITGFTNSSLFPGFAQVAFIGQDTNATSQEIQLLSPEDSKLNWVVGLYYIDTTAALDLAVNINGNTVYSVDDALATKSYSGFAQATYPIATDTNITFGARYTIDHRKIYGLRNNAPLVPMDNTWKEPTWRISLDHHFNPNLMVYGSVNTGFKSGIYNTGGPGGPPVNPEKLTSYELGMKGKALDSQLTFSIAGFYYDYKDIQLVKVQAVGGSTLQNAAKAEIYGLEAEGQFRITPELDFNWAGAIQHSEYTDFPAAASVIILPTGLGTGTAVDATGNQLIRAPDITANASLDYHKRLSFGTMDASLSYYYNDGFPFEADNRLRQESYSLVNASLSWTDPSDQYGIRLWASNLLKEEYYNIQISSVGRPDYGSAAAPRTYGVALHHKF